MQLYINNLKSVATFMMIALVAWLSSPTAHAQPGGGMQDLGTLGGSSSEARRTSADGSVVVGTSKNAANQLRVFRWTVAGGMKDAGRFEGSNVQFFGMSDDGSVVVWTSFDAAGKSRVFRLTADGVTRDLGTLGGMSAAAKGISADGSVVIGSSDNAPFASSRAFRWTAESGMQDLGTLGGWQSAATGVSADGSVVVGWSDDDVNGPYFSPRAFRWTAENGMQDLGSPVGWSSRAFSVSADGSAVIGRHYTNFGGFPPRAFRWTVGGGLTDLGTLAGRPIVPSYISTDGSVVAGMADLDYPGGFRVFRWTDVSGVQDLGDWRAEALSADGSVVVGFENSGGIATYASRWTPGCGIQYLGSLGGPRTSASSVSADGLVVVGQATNSSGQGRAFRWVGDTDGDGLLDDWECNGIPYTKADGTTSRYILDSTGDGVSDANRLRKDIFVEVDRMSGAPFISPEYLAQVIAAFDRAPVAAPMGVAGGLPGIKLHVVVDEQSIPFQEMISESQLPAYRQQWFGGSSERTGPDAVFLLAAKAKAFRYGMFANRMSTTDGLHLLGVVTGIPGTSFAVSMGGLTWPQAEIDRYLGSTFMHELGHTLGLCHGGSDSTHYKPNYISVMNYNYDELYYAVGGTLQRLPLDFSRETLASLDEACLNENIGVGPLPSWSTGVLVPFAYAAPLRRMVGHLRIGTVPLDWNGDGSISLCAREDITWFPAGNPLAGTATRDENLTGFNDWPAIVYKVPPFSLSVVEPILCPGDSRVCELTEELVNWNRENLRPSLPCPCPADFDGSGGTPDGTDIAAYFAAWLLGDPTADADCSGGTPDGTDITVFFNAWLAGGC